MSFISRRVGARLSPTRAPALALATAAALAACTAEPRYPVREGEAPGGRIEAMTPRYPIRQATGSTSTPPPVAVARAAPTGDDDAPRAAPSGEVSTTALPAPASPAAPIPYTQYLARKEAGAPRTGSTATSTTGRGSRAYASLGHRSAGIASTPRDPGIAPQSLPVSPGAAASSPGQVARLGRGRFVWPVRGAILSGFGEQGSGRRNDGVDIAAGSGDPVHAAAGGEVVYAGDQIPGFGNLVLVKHTGGWVTAYAHLSHIDVKMREAVTQGEPVGEAGQTGAVERPQLHFEIRYAASPADKARPVDPVALLPAAG